MESAADFCDALNVRLDPDRNVWRLFQSWHARGVDGGLRR